MNKKLLSLLVIFICQAINVYAMKKTTDKTKSSKKLLSFLTSKKHLLIYPVSTHPIKIENAIIDDYHINRYKASDTYIVDQATLKDQKRGLNLLMFSTGSIPDTIPVARVFYTVENKEAYLHAIGIKELDNEQKVNAHELLIKYLEKELLKQDCHTIHIRCGKVEMQEDFWKKLGYEYDTKYLKKSKIEKLKESSRIELIKSF